MLRFSLSNAGWKVIQASTASDALNALANQRLLAVVLDLDIKSEGVEAVLGRLNRPAAGDTAPTWVAVSALDRQEVALQFGPLRGTLLSKPFDPWVLARALEGRNFEGDGAQPP